MDAGLSATCHKCHMAVNEDDSSRRKKRVHGDKYKQLTLDEEVAWGELDDSVIERVLSKLPVADFFRFCSVCKGWSSLIQSPSFLTACHEVTRQPWFYMLDARSPAGVVYDTQAQLWRHINILDPANGSWRCRIPVAASGGLMCFRSSTGELIVRNLLTGSSRLLPALKTVVTVLAIAMHAMGSSYKLLIAFGRAPSFGIKVFSSTENSWKEMPITGTYEFATNPTSRKAEDDRAGNLLHRRGVLERRRDLRRRAGIIHRNPAKELSGVTTLCRSGHELIHFLNLNGRVVAFDTHQGIMCMYPHILPPEIEYSVDLVECGGRVLLVVLVEMMESVSLRVWEFDGAEAEWRQLMAMPPAMSKAFYGKKADINCVGHGDLIMVCISSQRFHQVVMCNITDGTWVELPKCYEPGTRTPKRFVSAYCFEPRIEACV